MSNLLEGLAGHQPILTVLLKWLPDHNALQLRQVCRRLDKAIRMNDVWWTSRCMGLTSKETLQEAREILYSEYLNRMHSALCESKNIDCIRREFGICISLLSVETRNQIQLYKGINEEGILF